MRIIICFALLLSISKPLYALLGEENALLFELVTTTASQLNELERLVTNAEKYTKRMQEYNELIQDEYFKAERVQYLVESLVAKKEIKNLGQLNYAIRELKYSLADLKELMKEYSIIKSEEDLSQKRVAIQKNLNEKKTARAQKQVASALRSPTTGRSTQITAQNTALIHESQIEMHNTQLDILSKVSTTNRLLAEQMEDKRQQEIEKRKAYGLEGKVAR